MIGGGDGIYGATKLVAERFCAAGMTALALAYWAQPGLPQNLARIPLEYVQQAAAALHKQGAKKVGIWGISKGAELALCAAAAFPESISCVVAASPFDAACQGILPSFKGLTDSSSWTLGGVDVAFARIKCSKPRIYAIERKDPAACSAARADATEKTLAFLSRW